ncbi:adhesin [Streptomyces sp. Je 1-79]|uniref:adhesin n=1 Tax=Streptomyces sp. Je 1-79 TaxID=2943847 RepID=UPI0021A960B5|nr:adhesin [Streptomyces sp. Je 1-79]MCT4356302.1 adhesin [Streptomyces sp. Je 1-79]
MACRHCGVGIRTGTGAWAGAGTGAGTGRGAGGGIRRGGAWALVAVVAVGCLALVVSLGGAEEPPPASETDPPVRALPVLPTRNGPTGFPGDEAAPPSASTSPSGSPSTTAPHPPPSPHGAPHEARYEEWAGPGCAGGAYTETGRYQDGFEGWYTVTRGGFRGGGCDGRFSAMPMSGSSTKDRDNSATWSWHVGPGYDTCALAVHVPSPPRPQDAAGEPSVYQVLANGTPYATFTVYQPANTGSLLPVGSYPLGTPTFTVRLVDRGQDWGSSAREGAHHAAGQMRLTCQA